MNKGGTITVICSVVATGLAVLTYVADPREDRVVYVEQSAPASPDVSSRSDSASIESLESEQRRLKLRRQNAEEKLRLEQVAADAAEAEQARRRRSEALDRARQLANPNVSGNWRLTNMLGTYTFSFRQDDSRLSVEEYDQAGNLVGRGSGTIDNRNVSLTLDESMFFTTVQSRLSLDLSSDNNRLSGSLYPHNGGVMQVTIFRQ